MMIWIRRALIVLVSLLVLAAIAVAGLVWNGERMRARIVQLPALQSPAFTDDTTARQRGAYLYASRGCTDCHGADGAGRVFVDDGKGLKIKGAAIHSGPGSATAGYTPQDWDRIVRHGVKRNGQPAIIMPSEDYNRFTDADFAALVSYVRALPPGGGGAAVIELPLPVRALYGAGYIEDAAAKIDHAARAAARAEACRSSTAHVANTCLGCHGPQLAGGPVPGGPPDWPPAARLNKGPDSALARYPNADAMVAMFRSGKRADGSEVKVMPFGSFSKMSDTDLRALHLYLKSL